MDGIIVDTSSILFALSNNIDIFSAVQEKLDLRPVISRGIVKELEKAAATKKANARYARVALSLVDKHRIRTEADPGYADRWILSAAASFSAVCTNDTQLRMELRKNGINVYAISKSGDFR